MWKVMLADDEKSIRTALGTLIDWQSLDCEVVYMARSGQDVLDHIGQYRPDLLITDIRMPGVDGVELLRRMRQSERLRSVPVVMATAKSKSGGSMAPMPMLTQAYPRATLYPTSMAKTSAMQSPKNTMRLFSLLLRL